MTDFCVSKLGSDVKQMIVSDDYVQRNTACD